MFTSHSTSQNWPAATFVRADLHIDRAAFRQAVRAEISKQDEFLKHRTGGSLAFWRESIFCEAVRRARSKAGDQQGAAISARIEALGNYYTADELQRIDELNDAMARCPINHRGNGEYRDLAAASRRIMAGARKRAVEIVFAEAEGRAVPFRPMRRAA